MVVVAPTVGRVAQTAVARAQLDDKPAAGRQTQAQLATELDSFFYTSNASTASGLLASGKFRQTPVKSPAKKKQRFGLNSTGEAGGGGGDRAPGGAKPVSTPVRPRLRLGHGAGDIRMHFLRSGGRKFGGRKNGGGLGSYAGFRTGSLKLEGFANLGNTCYMNAVVSAVLHQHHFVRDIASSVWTDAIQRHAAAAASKAASTSSSSSSPDGSSKHAVLDLTGGSPTTSVSSSSSSSIGTQGDNNSRSSSSSSSPDVSAKRDGRFVRSLLGVVESFRRRHPTPSSRSSSSSSSSSSSASSCSAKSGAGTQRPIDMGAFKREMERASGGRFAGNEQQDAHEFLGDLVNAIHDDLAPFARDVAEAVGLVQPDTATTATDETVDGGSSAKGQGSDEGGGGDTATTTTSSGKSDNKSGAQSAMDTKNEDDGDEDGTSSATAATANAPKGEGEKGEEEGSSNNDKESFEWLLPTTRSFHAEVDVMLRCSGCGYERRRTELYRDFSLDLVSAPPPAADAGAGESGAPPRHSRAQRVVGCALFVVLILVVLVLVLLPELNALMDHFFREELLELSCEKCPCKQAVKQCRLHALPGILVVHLKRFEADPRIPGRFHKRSDPVRLGGGRCIDVGRFCDEFTRNAPRPDDVLLASPRELAPLTTGSGDEAAAAAAAAEGSSGAAAATAGQNTTNAIVVESDDGANASDVTVVDNDSSDEREEEGDGGDQLTVAGTSLFDTPPPLPPRHKKRGRGAGQTPTGSATKATAGGGVVDVGCEADDEAENFLRRRKLDSDSGGSGDGAAAVAAVGLRAAVAVAVAAEAAAVERAGG